MAAGPMISSARLTEKHCYPVPEIATVNTRVFCIFCTHIAISEREAS